MMTEDGAAPRMVGREAARGPTMAEIAEWPGFDLELAPGGAGAQRRVRIAHATELADPSAFLRGGELIMTVGSALAERADAEAFVRRLREADAAGIALALGVRGHPTPPHLAAAAQAAGLGVLLVPPSVPFVTVAEELQRRSEQHAAAVRNREVDGALLDHVRRGLASPLVFRDRIDADRRVVALAVPLDLRVRMAGVLVEGWSDGRAVVVVDEPHGQALAELPPVPLFGAGQAVALAGLARSLKEAVAALAISVRRSAPAGPRDLATFGGLVERLGPDETGPFRDHVLAPLRAHDARVGTRLEHTVAAFLRAERSMSRTAAALGVHENSVRNRLARVAEVTGLDATRFEDCVALAIAVRSHGGPRPQRP